jgi:hypothetical protein
MSDSKPGINKAVKDIKRKRKTRINAFKALSFFQSGAASFIGGKIIKASYKWLLLFRMFW